MFDTYEIRQGGSQHHSHTHTIIEKRAPTDESVRLLREMEEKARQQVLSAIRLENCPIDGVVLVHHDQYHSGNREFLLCCRINGKPLEVRYLHDTLRASTQEDMVDGLLKATADAVARQILSAAFAALPRSKFGGPFS